MNGFHTPGIRIQVERNHVAAIKHEALSGARMTNPIRSPQ